MMRTARVAAVLACAAAACGRGEERDSARADYARLRERLAARAGQDPVVRQAAAVGGNVRVAVRPALVEAVFRRVAAEYLDHVELDLPLNASFEESGEVKVGALVRSITAGEWRVRGIVHRAQGVFRARDPEVRAAVGDRLAVRLPVTLEQGRGSATIHFRWDGRSAFRLVCRDFEVRRTVRGVVLPADYSMAGSFRLSSGPTGLRAEPEFPATRYRLRVDLTPESWREVEDAVVEQDRLLRCGLALEPGAVRTKLSAVLRRGFDVALPRSLFRAVDFPAAVREAAEVGGRRVELRVEPVALEVTPEAVWYGATVTTAVRAGIR